MNVTFTLPASFQPLEFLRAPRLAMRCDDARWLVSTILRKTANRDTDIWGCVRLHSSIMRRIMDKHAVGEIVDSLVAGGALETAPHCAGVKAKGYRLAQRYLGDRCIQIRVPDPRLLDRIERERERRKADEQRQRWKPIHYALAAEQRHVTIDEESEQILESLPPHTRLCQDVLVSDIRQRQHPFSVSSTGRVFNSITGLKRELRRALRIDGQHVGSVDIRCAQPALLAMLISQQVYPSAGEKSGATYKLTPSLSPSHAPAPSLPVYSLSVDADFSFFCVNGVRRLVL